MIKNSDLNAYTNKFELGYVFTIRDFPMVIENPKAVNTTLNHFLK